MRSIRETLRASGSARLGETAARPHVASTLTVPGQTYQFAPVTDLMAYEGARQRSTGPLLKPLLMSPRGAALMSDLTVDVDEHRAALTRRVHAAGERERRRRRKVVGGPLQIDPEATSLALRCAMAAGISPSAIVRSAQMSHDAVDRLMHRNPTRVLRSSAERLLEAMEKLLDARQRDLDDLRVHLEALADQLFPNTLRLPTDPLRETVRRRNVIVSGRLGTTDRRHFYRSQTLTADRADQLCFALGLMPEEVWGDQWSSAGALTTETGPSEVKGGAGAQ